MSLRQNTYGMLHSGCDVEFEIVQETEKAYELDDQAGFRFWLPKSLVGEDGEITPFGVKLITNKYAEYAQGGKFTPRMP